MFAPQIRRQHRPSLHDLDHARRANRPQLSRESRESPPLPRSIALTLAPHVPVGLFIYCCNQACAHLLLHHHHRHLLLLLLLLLRFTNPNLFQPVDFTNPPYTVVPKRFLRTVRNRRRVMTAAIALLVLLLTMNLAALATQIVSVTSPDSGSNS
jgi:hypothetical protein